MCDICNGMTHEESYQRTMRAIEQYGWAISGVEADPGWGGPTRSGCSRGSITPSSS